MSERPGRCNTSTPTRRRIEAARRLGLATIAAFSQCIISRWRCPRWVRLGLRSDVCFMSAFHPIATKLRTSRHFGFGPVPASCSAKVRKELYPPDTVWHAQCEKAPEHSGTYEESIGPVASLAHCERSYEDLMLFHCVLRGGRYEARRLHCLARFSVDVRLRDKCTIASHGAQILAFERSCLHCSIYSPNARSHVPR